MRLTDYHALYFALDLTRRRGPDSEDRLATSVASATIDLNPHQIDAALFAFDSPLSKGAILADEVGLGKTIEAGLVISQRWAERKRRLLIVTPANLRKQWHQELSEKFFLDCLILDGGSYKGMVKAGVVRPFEIGDRVVICSYQFARAKAEDLKAVPWDLVVIDEAHRLRNVYKPTNKIANALKDALSHAPKILLTATPLQNSLLELYGLVSVVDDRVFGDPRSFREQFAYLGQGEAFGALKARLKPVCHRTLRRQVQAYVSYTRRHALVEEFRPSEAEDRLYALVSDYLRRPNLKALPEGQRTLITLVLRKLLASSTFAIAGALETMIGRLKQLLENRVDGSLEQELEVDYESLDATADEWEEAPVEATLSEDERKALAAEIAELESFTRLASSIDHNAKGKALLSALKEGLRRAEKLGAERKAIIFTESRKTQDYLLRLLADTSHAGRLVLFNGTNTDARSREIYQAWVERNQGSARITGSRAADMRSAIVDYFRDEGEIMIATEAGAEGINLQFCSLVVNYDLPWNPQRIEQRIGRCHRYGQKHDVVVVNFINRKNEADLRVYQLLNEKFKLFEGVFGASDEVLGAIESGVDLEKRIGDIYQRCRQPQEIRAAFDALQLELRLEIDEAMNDTRQKLLEHFDDEVRDRLRLRDQASKEYLSRIDQMLLDVTRHELSDHAEFFDHGVFRVHSNPFPDTLPDLPLGLYELPRRTGDAHLYRMGDGLAEAILTRALDRRPLAPVEIMFDYESRVGKVSALEQLQGSSGWLRLSMFTSGSLGLTEDHAVFVGFEDNGSPTAPDALARLFGLDARVGPAHAVPADVDALLRWRTEEQYQRIRVELTARNTRFFEDEVTKLDRWADDLKLGLARELKDLDNQLREVKRAATLAVSLEDKVEGQRRIKTIEGQRTNKRRTLFDAEDAIDGRRETLIADVQARLAQSSSSADMFTIRWTLS